MQEVQQPYTGLAVLSGLFLLVLPVAEIVALLASPGPRRGGTASAAALGVAGGRGRGGSGNHRQLCLPQRHRRAAAERRVVVIQQCDGRDIHRGERPSP
ncbi:MAG TPA: hypothetical protein VMR00_15470 [Streptosporangiaceae bacterium]|nr:hypothetical protein [Streptosporangiaceae bacterium]